MAQFVYTNAMKQMIVTTAPIPMDASSTYKMMLVNASQAANKADTNVGTNLTAAEIGSGGAVTNYTRGYGGSGRKVITSMSLVIATNVVNCVFGANITWSALGGAVNDTIRGCALIKEITNDAGSLPIAYWDISPAVTTNGSDFTITVAVSPSGNITFTT